MGLPLLSPLVKGLRERLRSGSDHEQRLCHFIGRLQSCNAGPRSVSYEQGSSWGRRREKRAYPSQPRRFFLIIPIGNSGRAAGA